MVVISSQRYLDYGIVDKKVEEIKNETVITLPVINSGLKDNTGEELFILVDGHHRKEAAEELGIEVEYEEVENEHGVEGDELLLACYNDSDWYYVDTEKLVNW